MKKYFRRILCSLIMACILVGNLGMSVIANAMEGASIKEGNYTLKNDYSGKFLNVSGGKTANGTNINIYEGNGKKSQTYRIYKINSSYALSSTCTSSEKLVNVKGDKVKANANVMLYEKSGKGHSTQRWIFEKVSGGYILKSVNNTKYVLTCTDSKSGSNVNVQVYKKGNKKQIWKLESKNSSPNTTEELNSSNKEKSVSEIKLQITKAYKKCREITGRSDFKKQCSLYVYSQLKVLGIYQTPDTYWNGNQWYSKLKSNAVTETGYTQKKYSGKSCLSKIVDANNNENVYDIVVSFPNSYVDGNNNGSGGAGHVLFIHAIIYGKVYYSDNYRYCGMSEGSVIVKTVSEFTNYFSYHYGGPIGAIHFDK
ncbi:RICIN domain-containing protein [Terrisporobacter mayombei]|uniref:Ricin B lectin domain-containing protein n=1 Tax=Terrisporobacter mayombei TaxID=1541 RepID=A0ABY9Q465_9FIRM|nr:RICIN domain-containing protein [Terrisporobacter mayombei]MCC3869088.1 RICIN domain-containing protein [Terrisporobacter mayombei]WMT82778.1 hypothetical protein TEMA_32700 [Terrisporobacter mayombei]